MCNFFNSKYLVSQACISKKCIYLLGEFFKMLLMTATIHVIGQTNVKMLNPLQFSHSYYHFPHHLRFVENKRTLQKSNHKSKVFGSSLKCCQAFKKLKKIRNCTNFFNFKCLASQTCISKNMHIFVERIF